MSRIGFDKKMVRRRLGQRKTIVCVGKAGASAELLMEIKRQLKQKEIVKVRILKSAVANGESEGFATTIARNTEASLVEVRGNTFILYKNDEK